MEIGHDGVCLGEFCLEGRVLQRTVSKDLCFERGFHGGGFVSREVYLDGGRPQRTTVSMEGNLDESSPSMEVCLNGGLSRWRSASMEVRLDGDRPRGQKG